MPTVEELQEKLDRAQRMLDGHQSVPPMPGQEAATEHANLLRSLKALVKVRQKALDYGKSQAKENPDPTNPSQPETPSF